MRLFVAVTDCNWFEFLASQAKVDEVNFWTPTPRAFRALNPGEILLFKLHAPKNEIAGGGFFVRHLTLPVSLAWKAFGEKNGAASLEQLRESIGRYRRTQLGPWEDPEIGCILLSEPFFWQPHEWIPCPSDFAPSIVVGKTYDTSDVIGRELWAEVQARLRSNSDREAAFAAAPSAGSLRLGEGLFRVLVLEAYSRRCALSGEAALPALEVTHIKPLVVVQQYELRNGLPLRADLCRLWDAGYITVEPKTRRILVSKRIQEEFPGESAYYGLLGRSMLEPSDPVAKPPYDYLAYHYEHIFH